MRRTVSGGSPIACFGLFTRYTVQGSREGTVSCREDRQF